MKAFKIPQIPSTTNKCIRFPNDVIEEVEKAIEGKNCTFTAFVIEAVRVALANIEDVYNGIMVTGDAVGDVTFNGRGAGKFPTASAVCSDVIDAARDSIQYSIFWKDEGRDFIRSFEDIKFNYLPGTDIPVIE